MTLDDAPRRDAEVALTLLALALFAWASVTGGGAGWPGVLPALGLALAAASDGVGIEARLVALIGAAACAATTVALPPVWPIAQLVVVAPAMVAIALVPVLRPARAWLRFGRFDLLPIALVGGAAAVALPLWTMLAKPDLASTMAMLPQWPLPLMIAGAVIFSITNAILEEIAFRGVVQGALESLLGPNSSFALLGQGAAFGVMHWAGFPSGPIGVAMVTFWGVVLGWARRRSGGLLTPVLGHVVADAVIFGLLFTHAS